MLPSKVHKAASNARISHRYVSDQVKQTFPAPPQSNYTSTLKNLNIRSNAKVVVIGQTSKVGKPIPQSLEAIEKSGTNVVGFVDETSPDLSSSIQNVLKDALPWVLYISTQKATPVLEALKCASKVQIPLVVCSTAHFEEGEIKEVCLQIIGYDTIHLTHAPAVAKRNAGSKLVD
ncbi:hypothetical protein QFC19_000614 [Naganishia cerealis]|uniref:Uncharacterized protein n=1 Tax=Naganishia cerealis TaxID=610337 RepID=A0ACC2WMR5_9TREE|nr:hypothetical protein QFC19_000614 [Naganishia cerealis]